MDLEDMVKPSLLQRQKRRDKRMDEEVIEVGRYSGGKKDKVLREKGYKKFYKKNFPDSYPTNISIAPKGRMTQFDDNLGLLKKFLMTHVGQKWDDVFAKLNAQLDSRSLQGQHIIGHLFDFVETYVEIHDGYYIRKHYHGRLYVYDPNVMDKWYQNQNFYVHPDTGILCRWQPPKKTICPKKARYKKEKERLKGRLRAAYKTDKTPPKSVEIKRTSRNNREGEKKSKSVLSFSNDIDASIKQHWFDEWYEVYQHQLEAIEDEKPKTSEECFRLLF